MNMKKPILGVCGTFASGKDTVAEILEKEYKIYHVSTGDIVREKAMELYGNKERETLHKTATEFRQNQGGDYFVREGYRRYQEVQEQYSGIIFTGVRSLGEGRAVLALGGDLVFVDAPVQVRYDRMASRQRDSETRKTMQEFLEFEKKERGGDSDDEWAFNIDKLGEMAAYKIDNSSTYDAFIENVNKLATEVGLTK